MRARALRQSEPMLNVPWVVSALLLAMLAIHVVREYLLAPQTEFSLLVWFAFVPARYASAVAAQGGAGGLGPQIWTFVTYALLHGDFVHLGVNAVWFLAFGSAVARRFGPWRFLLFFAVTAAAGAATHLATHGFERVVMVGASAAISAFMAAAARFVFQGGGPLGLWSRNEPHSS